MVYVPTGKAQTAREPAAGFTWSPQPGTSPASTGGRANLRALLDQQCPLGAPPRAVQFHRPAHRAACQGPDLHQSERLQAPGPAARLSAWVGGVCFPST
jgi:hypothetical protein